MPVPIRPSEGVTDMPVEIQDQLKNFLDPILAGFGFLPGTIFWKTEYLSDGEYKRPTRLHYKHGDDTLGLGMVPSIDIFYSDMYPNDRGEAFMHCWNRIGSDTKARDLVAFLNSKGVKARSTTHKKMKGVRFHFPYNWDY
jgi:hypothetical protein